MSARKNLAQFAKTEINKINQAVDGAKSPDEAVAVVGDASYFFEGAEAGLKAAGLDANDFAPVSLALGQLNARLDFIKKQQEFEASLGGE
jgi:hypothetical protein